MAKDTDLVKRVKELEQELDALRGRIARRKPLAQLRDFRNYINIRDGIPAGYTILRDGDEGRHVNRVCAEFGLAHATAVKYYPAPVGFNVDHKGVLVEEEVANRVAAIVQELEAGRLKTLDLWRKKLTDFDHLLAA